MWNYHEAGHGKGIPDGIGGTLKRMADLRVRHGKYIMSTSAFNDELESETSIKLYLIGDANAEEANLKQLQLKPIPGTRSLHQIIVMAPGHLHYRDVKLQLLSQKTMQGP